MADSRINSILNDQKNAVNQSNNTYNGLVQGANDLYNKQMDYTNQQSQIQQDNINKQTDFNVSEIERNKQKVTKDFEDEQIAAGNAHEKFIDPYGVQAEQRASQGLSNTGYSETVQLGAYNIYQRRIGTAKSSLTEAMTQYDSDITKARLEGDTLLAENALKKLEMQVNFAKDLYDTSSQLKQSQLQNNQQLSQDYYGRMMSMYGQINEEKKLSESIRQFNKNYALDTKKFNLSKSQFAWQKKNDNRNYSLALKEFNLKKKLASQAKRRASSGGGRSYSRSSGSGGGYVLKKTSSGKFIKMNSTPLFTTKKAGKWYAKNVSTKSTLKAGGMNSKTLKKKLASGYKSGALNKTDVAKALKNAGMK